LILATAGLVRLDLGSRITARLSSPHILHAVGQGALAVETRSADPEVNDVLGKLEHWQTGWCVRAEREMLRVLEGGCSVPVGVESRLEQAPEGGKKGTLTLDAVIVSLDGQTAVEKSVSMVVENVEEAVKVGNDLAKQLFESGGKEILEDLGKKVEGEKKALGIESVVP
jgi:hydroxymethylbilane synthase